MLYLPEGLMKQSPGNMEVLQKAYEKGEILEAEVLRCDVEHNLIVDLGGVTGVIPRMEAALQIDRDNVRDIEIISRVGKPVCFLITDMQGLSESPPKILLSRRAAQEKAAASLLGGLLPGDVIRGRVTHLEKFGVFVDIGCGFTSFISIENISVSRFSHPNDRFTVGQMLYAAVKEVDKEQVRITLTHKELLGTWEENAACFSPGETVTGIVRGIEHYGMFIELRPNLSGLAERRPDTEVGQRVSVYIKALIPERMKIKLAVIDLLTAPVQRQAPEYFITEGRLERWQYSPVNCAGKDIHTDFSKG